MNNRRAIRWARNPVLAGLLLAAFVARSLIPAGFMPGPHGLMLCSSYAPITQAITHDMSEMDMSGVDLSAGNMAHHHGDAGDGIPAPDHTQHEICPFAAASAAMGACNAPAAAIHIYLVSTDLVLPAPPVVPRGTIVPTRLPRGPPHYS